MKPSLFPSPFFSMLNSLCFHFISSYASIKHSLRTFHLFFSVNEILIASITPLFIHHSYPPYLLYIPIFLFHYSNPLCFHLVSSYPSFKPYLLLFHLFFCFIQTFPASMTSLLYNSDPPCFHSIYFFSIIQPCYFYLTSVFKTNFLLLPSHLYTA